MARPVIYFAARRRPASAVMTALSQLGLVLLLSLMSCRLALAQTLADPTRPSTMQVSPAGAEAVTGPVLQSILMAPNRHIAIISGQAVALNGKYGDQTLIRMSETEVVLRNGKELQILKLFPDFNKKSSQGNVSAKRPTTTRP